MSGPGNQPAEAANAGRAHRLAPANWDPGVREKLQTLIDTEADANRVAVFDLDNTLLCRDIGDATFEVLARSGKLDDARLGRGLLPPARAAQPLPDAWFEQYETLLEPDPDDPGAKLAGAYTWVTQLMAGLTVADVVDGTTRAWAGEGLRRYPRPFLYPEMVDLLGLLSTRGVQVYVVSASNLWTVRWVIRNALNPLLAERYGPAACLPPERVFGMALLLCDDRTGRLHTDAALLQSDPEYASLSVGETAHYTLTPHLVPPLTTGAGKVAAVLHHITDGPVWLAAGDSLNDLPLLRHARHRLWIERREPSPHPGDTWLVQPARIGASPGFTSAP